MKTVQSKDGATFIQLAGQDHLVSAKALLPVLVNFLKPQPQPQAVKLS